MLHSAQAEAEGIIRDLKKAESSKGKEVLEARHRLDKKLDDMVEPMVKSQNASEGAALTKVTLGQTVMIPSLGCTGSEEYGWQIKTVWSVGYKFEVK